MAPAVYGLMRDERPFAGPDPPAAVFFYPLNRSSKPLAGRMHGRMFFDLTRLGKPRIAAEAVKRIDVPFAIEREINGLMP